MFTPEGHKKTDSMKELPTNQVRANWNKKKNRTFRIFSSFFLASDDWTTSLFSYWTLPKAK